MVDNFGDLVSRNRLRRVLDVRRMDRRRRRQNSSLHRILEPLRHLFQIGIQGRRRALLLDPWHLHFKLSIFIVNDARLAGIHLHLSG